MTVENWFPAAAPQNY